jgi:hypothetical protein
MDIGELIDESMLAASVEASGRQAAQEAADIGATNPLEHIDGAKINAQSASQGKRSAPADFLWSGSRKKISMTSAIEIQDESLFGEQEY